MLWGKAGTAPVGPAPPVQSETWETTESPLLRSLPPSPAQPACPPSQAETWDPTEPQRRSSSQYSRASASNVEPELRDSLRDSRGAVTLPALGGYAADPNAAEEPTQAHTYGRRHLRDRWKLVLFGYDDGHDEDREPLADQDGALFLVFVITCLTYFFGLGHNGASRGGRGKHKAGSACTGTHAFFNLVLAGLFTFVSDTWNMVTVVDQMAQAIHQKQGVGYEAYGAASGAGKIALFRCGS
ncbi:hypothetical protein JL721_12376 [Aureococcus anophagefferens]|nr:hypothetical protein JL721_12376 [Aureococcus anophagefferens]